MMVLFRQTGRRRGRRSKPRVDVVFRIGQCDKKNHGWRERPPLTVPCQSVDLLAGPSPSDKVSFEREKLCVGGRALN
jgi:hypothetical protein